MLGKFAKRVDPGQAPLDLGMNGPWSGPRLVQGATDMKYMLVMRAARAELERAVSLCGSEPERTVLRRKIADIAGRA